MTLTFREKGIQYIEIKMHVPHEFRQKLKLFWGLGFVNSKSIKLGDKEIIPRELLVHLVSRLQQKRLNRMISAVITGEKGGERREYMVQLNH